MKYNTITHKRFIKKISVSILVILLLVACKEKAPISNEPVSISINRGEEDICQFISKLSKGKVDYIPLETSKDAFFGPITNLLMDNNNNVYIFDKYETKRIIAFDKNGKHKFNIGKTGKSAGEYISISDIDIKDNQLIALVYTGKSHLYYYDLNNGELAHTKQVSKDISAISMKATDDGFLFYVGGYNNDNHDLIRTNSSLEKQGKLHKKATQLIPVSEPCLCRCHNSEKIYYWDYIKCDVIEVEEDTSRIIISIEDATKQKNEIKATDDIHPYFSGEKALYILSNMASNGTLFYLLIVKQEAMNLSFYHVFYNSKTKQYKVYNDNSKEEPSITAPYFVDNDFYCLMPTSTNSKITNKEMKPENNPLLVKIAF